MMSELLKINVNDHVEKKNGLTYLSWAWAWAEVLKIDPVANWDLCTFGPQDNPRPFMQIGKTAMVAVTVTIKGIKRHCQLPVMDHRNKAIPEPDAFQVNTAIMRCLAKAIAMHGLGLYIYAGEDLPEGDEPEKPEPKDFTTNGAKLLAEDAATRLTAERKDDLTEDALKIVTAFRGLRTDVVMEVYDSITDNDEKAFLWHLLAKESKVRAFIKAQAEERRKATA